MKETCSICLEAEFARDTMIAGSIIDRHSADRHIVIIDRRSSLQIVRVLLHPLPSMTLKLENATV